MLDEIGRHGASGSAAQAFVVCLGDQDGSAFAAFGYDLRFALGGAVDEFAEVGFGFVELPGAFGHGGGSV